MKFDYAYLENKKSELSVFQIALIYRNIPLFRAEYEPYMVCPICKEAKLTYVNDQPAYLRTAQKQSHAEDCPLAQLYLSTNRAKTIMNSFNSEDRDYVSRQLHSLLTRISHVKPQKTSICKTNTNHATNFHIEKTPPQITQEGKHLQSKNLLMGFRDEDYNTPLLGYGKFSIEMENKDDRHTLLLRRIATNEHTSSSLACRVFISKKVFLYLPVEYKYLKQQIGYVALFSEFQKSKSGRPYVVTKLCHSSNLQILLI